MRKILTVKVEEGRVCGEMRWKVFVHGRDLVMRWQRRKLTSTWYGLVTNT